MQIKESEIYAERLASEAAQDLIVNQKAVAATVSGIGIATKVMTTNIGTTIKDS